jgi:c-di-GMP-binding flagellar brake protein YcgR
METVMERRVSQRRRVPFQVKYFYLPPDANPPSTRVIDLSTDGACVETLDVFQEGAAVAFFIVTPENQVIDVRAQVMRMEPAERPPYRAGVRFTQLSPSDRAALQRALEHSGT